MAFTSLSGTRVPRSFALPVTISTSYQLVGLPENNIILESHGNGAPSAVRPSAPLFFSAILIPPAYVSVFASYNIFGSGTKCSSFLFYCVVR